MRKAKVIKDTTSDSTLYRKALRREFDCSMCPPNRKENSGGHRKPRPDKHKNKRRETIRKPE